MRGVDEKSNYTFSGPMRYENYPEYLEKTKKNVQISIELSSHCNFHCYYCQYPNMKRKKEHIEDKMFYHLADQLQDTDRKAVGVNWAGESTLHPKFIEYATYLNDMGLKIAMPSNGSRLSSDLFKVDFAWIQIYLDKSAEDFKRRSNLDYDTHVKRILKFAREWLTNDSSLMLKLWLQKTKADVEDSRNLLAKYDFLKWFIGELGLTEKIELDFSNRTIGTYTKSNGGVLQFGQMPILSGGIFPVTDDNPAAEFDHEDDAHGFCDSAWKHTKVTVDGRLTLCCQSLEGKTIFSKAEDIWKKSIMDIWEHDEEVERYRAAMLKGDLLYDVCRKCLDAFPRRELYHPHHVTFEKTAPPYTLGKQISFDISGAGDSYTGKGFAPPTNLTWTMLSQAQMVLNVKDMPKKGDLILDIDAVARLANDGSDRDFFEIFVNGKKVAQLQVSDGKLEKYQARIERSCVGDDGLVKVDFVMSNHPPDFLPMNFNNITRMGLQTLTLGSSEVSMTSR